MRKKLYFSILIVINLFVLDSFIVFADNTSFRDSAFWIDESYKEYLEKNVPDKISDYFNLLYEDVIGAYAETCCKDENINISELEAGNPFIINNINTDIGCEVWYYPIYDNQVIICLICIFESDNVLHCTVTEEFVDQLNEMQYCPDDIIIKEDDEIYAINNNNNIRLLDNTNPSLCESGRKYDELYYLIKKNRNISNNDKNNIRRSPVKYTNTSAECDMTNCLVQQYNYDLCWAASVATIIRYKKPMYQSINAFDVAYALGECYGIDTSTNKGKWKCLVGREISDIQTALALYGIYYTYDNSVLNFEIVKKEIQNSEPMIMGAISKEGKYIYGHSTVLYGYVSSGNTNLLKIWNPGNATAQLVVCVDGKDAQYIYKDYIYSWYSTIYNGAYISRYK